MKLYDPKNSFRSEASAESFVNDYASLRVVSAESVDSFLSKVQDTLRGVVVRLDPDHERFRQDAWLRQRNAVVRAREVPFNLFRHEVLSKPEAFKGYFTEYLKDLHKTSGELGAQCTQLLETLQMAIGAFINEHTDEKVSQLYGRMVFEGAQKRLPVLQKALSGYFKAPAGQVKTRAEDVLKSMQDIESLYALGTLTAQVFTPSAVQEMDRQVRSTADLVDALVQVNLGNGVLTRHAQCKQQLVEAIHLTAQYVECYHAALAHWVFYCKCFNDLTYRVVNYEEQDTQGKDNRILAMFGLSPGVAAEGVVTGIAGDMVRNVTDSIRDIRGWFQGVEEKRRFINENVDETVRWLKDEQSSHSNLKLDMGMFKTWMKTSETFNWRFYFITHDPVYHNLLQDIKNDSTTQLEGIYDVNVSVRMQATRRLDNIKDIQGLIDVMELYRKRCNFLFEALLKRKRAVQGFPYQVMLLGYNDLNRFCAKAVNLAL